ncbi:MAG: prolipoprotein diacylglyceryl transferase [Arenicella sp.]
MLVHPNFDPVIVSIGPLSIQWYGLMYLLGFLSAYWLANVRKQRLNWNSEDVSDLIFYAAMGVILGGRLGYALLYKAQFYFTNPLEILKVWEGGMSFHGGLLGVGLALVLIARKKRLPFYQVADFVAPLAPLGLFFGRMGNFINQELWGRVTDVPWGMVFQTGGNLPRHPSMLYEAMLEGIVLFIVLWSFTRKPKAMGQATGLFLLGYGIFRFLVEIVREPDTHIGYIAFDWFTIGQLYCIPMVLFGIYLLCRTSKIQNPA